MENGKKALANEEIYTTRVTHGGRHPGSMEAEGLGIPFDLIERGGEWKDQLGRLETHYLSKLPSPFTREWIAVCEKEMDEVDENEDEDENIINLDIDKEVDSVEFVEEDGRNQSKEKKRKGKQRATQSIKTSMSTQKKLPLSSNSSEMLQEYIVAAITSPSVGRLEEYENLVPKIVDTNKEVASRGTEDLLLINMTQQLAKDIKILMIQQQRLNSQMQLLMAINNASQSINTNASLSQPPIFPVLSTTHSMSPLLSLTLLLLLLSLSRNQFL
ncbi:hypothetical protein PHYBLDRAFT_63947 [Phycomyces blakesleeanus NRRL 1555(-)]|uniref:Uncharacterized protein n=1 Tax=Phycomyces blakesleeanus (strain ATCC 8743b / DSM 1359 / FGSC 10004 / NBRC 33097 / NRRL 1555) TaxID=763407 RepID=A0A162U7N3_PHYB8|nr:hypothetical protein PHYBLDRAFT_63947 [Phycomyces blakesleeanus NRRL 1555(-)]OAD74102.1 hypothetical protein PHYBLDRAFT_63947 [Phycomyces blakesleeanus NRRL 1555(-)]|eukprot:XP_018292142.1 hypothetical protein PHYBLDRAFT_63947 [Phycomyces blakesleeanus NRRL 1555(-)]